MRIIAKGRLMALATRYDDCLPQVAAWYSIAEAIQEIDRLLDRSERSTAQEAYLGALTDLVETYEAAHITIPLARGVEALRYLMEENGLIQAERRPFSGRHR